MFQITGQKFLEKKIIILFFGTTLFLEKEN
jgi:hypothetical protein